MPAAFQVRELDHVSLFVRDLEATRHFYRDVLGLTETGAGKNGRIVFFSVQRRGERRRSSPTPPTAVNVGGDSVTASSNGVRHHDVSCELARSPGPGPQPKGVPGLYHFAFRVGSGTEALEEARRWVESHGLTPFGETPTSISVRDPDGNEIELRDD